MKARVLPVALALLFAASAVSRAEEKKATSAIAIAAEHLEIDLETKTAVATGHVRLSRDDLAIACPRLDIRYDKVPNVTSARGSGGVVADVRGVHAEAPAVTLDVAAQTVELSGGVKVTQEGGWLTADRALVNLATGKVTLTDVKGSIPVPSKR